MNNNIRMNENANYGIDFTGPHMVIHHQYYQIVDLLIQYCRQLICGLNPYALLYALLKHRSIEIKNKDQDEKEKKPNLSKSKQGWQTQNKAKGKSYKNNKQNKEKNTDICGNQFS